MAATGSDHARKGRWLRFRAPFGPAESPLAGADFGDADLKDAIFSGADVDGAIFTGATSLDCAALRKAENWQSAKGHSCP
jgi:hypothetical protein